MKLKKLLVEFAGKVATDDFRGALELQKQIIEEKSKQKLAQAASREFKLMEELDAEHAVVVTDLFEKVDEKYSAMLEQVIEKLDDEACEGLKKVIAKLTQKQ